MAERNWLTYQASKAKSEIEAWPEWKRESLRSEINNYKTRESNTGWEVPVVSGRHRIQKKSA